jgi:hypothetical protein
MKLFTLNYTNPFIELTLKSKESYITIKSIHLKHKDNKDKDWVDDFSKVKLLVTHHYLVYDSELNFDERSSIEKTILVFPEINQMEPILNLNETIPNDVLTIGWNSSEKFYTTLKLEIQNIQVTYVVVLDLELFDAEEKC